MSTTQTLHEHAVEVDTRLHNAHWELAKVNLEIENYESEIHRSAGHTYDWTRTRLWSGTLDEALAHTDFHSEWSAKAHAQAIAKREPLLVERDRLRAIMLECHKDWREHGFWSRFYLVTNANGHVHSSTDCSTCYDSTNFVWLTNLSGLTEADAVAQEGEILCSVCFPSAPVSWTNGKGRRDAEAQAKREAEKAERLRKKAEKSLSLDGSVVEISMPPRDGRKYSEYKEFKTLRSAELWLVDAYAHILRTTLPEDRQWCYNAPDAYSEANLLRVLELWSAKTDRPASEIIETSMKKARQRFKKNS